MLSFKNLLVVCMMSGLVGCVAPQSKTVHLPPSDYVPVEKIKISSKFNTIELTKENLSAEIKRCVPQIDSESESSKKFVAGFPYNSVVFNGHLSSANQFWIKKTTGMCLQKSSNNFPIFAAEAFLYTINPLGVPPDITDGWYKEIALNIATKGSAKVAYVFASGTAYVVDYWTDVQTSLRYAGSFRKAGAWETEKLDARFAHPNMSSLEEVKSGGQTMKSNLLSHRLL